MKSQPRILLAFLIVALWVDGLAMMFHRNANRTDAQQLAEVALRVQPATFYYTIERDGKQIGAASSALDTTSNTLVSEEYFVGDYPVGGATQRTSARWQTRLTRGFRLTDLTIDIARQTRPFSINASVEEDTTLFIAGNKTSGGHPPAHYTFKPTLFTPSLAAVAFMLGGPPKIGRSQTLSVFNPKSRLVVRPQMRIAAESVFTVIDSAALEPDGQWVVAHRDTVRAWRIDGVDNVSAWVDDAGRIVAARAGDFSATRTAFELAFKATKSTNSTLAIKPQTRRVK